MVLRDGRYYGTIVSNSARATKTAKSGTPQILIDFNVTHIKSGVDGTGATLWDPLPQTALATVKLFLTDKAKEFTAQKLESIGCTGMKPFVFTERGAELNMKNDSQYGEQWDIAGSEPTPMGESELAELDAVWKAKHPQAATVVAAPVAPADLQSAANVPGPTSGDAIPF